MSKRSLVFGVLCLATCLGRTTALASVRHIHKPRSHTSSRLVLTSLVPPGYEYTIPHPASGSYPAAIDVLIGGKVFRPGAQARWNGRLVPTAYDSPLQVTARVPFERVRRASRGAGSEVRVRITVANPGERSSRSVPFLVRTTAIE